MPPAVTSDFLESPCRIPWHRHCVRRGSGRAEASSVKQSALSGEQATATRAEAASAVDRAAHSGNPAMQPSRFQLALDLGVPRGVPLSGVGGEGAFSQEQEWRGRDSTGVPRRPCVPPVTLSAATAAQRPETVTAHGVSIFRPRLLIRRKPSDERECPDGSQTEDGTSLPVES